MKLTSVCCLIVAVVATHAQADTFIVTNTNDSGAGSLHEAINAANASTEPGFHLIRFDLPCSSGGGQPTISLQSDLPVVVGPVDIDGTTACGNVLIDRGGGAVGLQFVFSPEGRTLDLYQALRHVDIQHAGVGIWNHAGQQFSGRTGMLITGCNITNVGAGVQLDGINGAIIGEATNPSAAAPLNGGNIIRGSGASIRITGGGAHSIRGNILGPGTYGGYVIWIEDSGANVIGGDSSADGNLVTPSSDTGIGIYIHSKAAIGGNLIAGNSIILDTPNTNNNSPGSGSRGVVIAYSPKNVLRNNLIRIAVGNTTDVYIEGDASAGAKLYGNVIGSTAGNAPAGVHTGVDVIVASDVVIGGPTPELGNVFGGTNIFLERADRAVIQGNFIGTDSSGVTDLGSSGWAISASRAVNAVIGGSAAGEGNTIAFNAAGAIRLYKSDSSNTGFPKTDPFSNVAIRGNSIYQNGGTTQGIDLSGDGPTPNDVGDTDEGANHLQNFPVITKAATTVGETSYHRGDTLTRISGTLGSTPSADFVLDFYATGPSPNNNRNRQFYLGSTTARTDATGTASFTFDANQPGSVPIGNSIVATATDVNGNTSEFSAPATVVDDSGGFNGSADVALSGTVSASAAARGATLTYSFTCFLGRYNGVRFVDTLPSGLTLRTVAVDGDGSVAYSVNQSGNTATVTLTGGYNSTPTITITATIDADAPRGAYLTNRAMLVLPTVPDADPFNNYVALTTRVSDSSSLLNISTRMPVLTGTNAAIGGFIVTGASPKKVMIRGIGPSLRANGIGDALADPTIELHDSTGALIGYNDNWRDSDAAAIQATGLAPTDNAESALIATVPANTAAYTAVLRGKNDTIGVGLVEVYDLAQDTDSRLANISTRGYVDRFDNVMVGGVIVGPTGSAPARIVVRGIGPSLSSTVPGALQDPTVELHDANGTTIDANDNWKERQQAEIEATGIAPTDDRESALVTTVAPGNYTAVLRGQNATTGPALVEVYNLQ